MRNFCVSIGKAGLGWNYNFNLESVSVPSPKKKSYLLKPAVFKNNEICALIGFYATQNGSPETSVGNYYSTLCNIPEE